MITIKPSEELKILRNIVDLTSSKLDLKIILKNIVHSVTEITSADSVFIYLFEKNNKNLVLMASKTPHLKELGKIKLKIGEGITGWVAKETKPVSIIENAYKDPRFKSFDVLPEDKYESFLAVPILYQENVIGVINIQHKEKYKHSKKIIELITTISKQVGGVIENAKLYEETKEKALQFDSLVKISSTINSEKYLDEILNLIVLITAKTLNSKICSIMLVDETKKENLVLKATQELSPEYTLKPPLKINDSLSGEVLKSKKPKSFYDVCKEKKYAFKEFAIKAGLTSMLCLPMIVKEKAIGILNIYTKEHHEFSQEEIDIIQIIANQVAVSIENTKLMEQALKAKKALETRKIIERAKGLLMNTYNLTEEAAYKLIHKKSMDSSRSMKEISEAIILANEIGKN